MSVSQKPCPASKIAYSLQMGDVVVELRRSGKRRTLVLQVRNGLATAYAPLTMPEETIQRFLKQKANWIQRHVLAQQQQHSSPLHHGDSLIFCGEALLIGIHPDRRKVEREGQTLWLPTDNHPEKLKSWLRQAAFPSYQTVVKDYAKQLGVLPKLRSVQVSDTASRWGSCNARGDIRLHWALGRAPLEVLHYVALHEVAHLIHFNHSPQYWAVIRQQMPEYQRHKAWLREHGSSLRQL